MDYPSNHLHLMSTEDCNSRFWSNVYGLAADNYKVIFANDFMKRYGICDLYNKINKDVIENNISLLLIDISSPIYDPFIIFDLKQKYGLMVVLLALDDEFKFDWISSTYATIADLVLTTDYVSANRYRQAGVNAHFFMLPVYIPPEMPDQSINDIKYNVSFVGMVDKSKPSRVEFARFLANNRIAVSYFGCSGTNDSSYLSLDEMYSIFRKSSINLNFTGITTYLEQYDNVLYKRIRGMKLRPLEVLAAGGFCISEYSISLAKLFEDGVDIVFFRSKAELVEKIMYFDSHRDEAKRIANNGTKKIKEQYSNEALANRLKALVQESLKYLGIDLFGEPHRVKVSRWLASSFIAFTLSNSVNLLFKGKLLSFIKDIWHLFRFMRRLSASNDTLLAPQLAFLALLKLGKAVLVKTISILLH